MNGVGLLGGHDAVSPRQAQPRSDARGSVLFGVGVLVLFFGGAGGWAALAPLNGAAVAPAAVKVDGNRKSLEHREGGTVRDILVRNGDRVEQDQALVLLDDTAVRGEVEVLQAQQDAAAVTKARLLAERDETGQLAVDGDLGVRAGEPALAALLATQAALLIERRRQMEGEIAVLRQQILQLQQEIDGGEAQLEGVRRQRALIEEEVGALRVLLRQALVPRSRVLALDRNAAGLDADRGRVLAEVARARAQVGEKNLRILQVRQERMTEVSTGLQDADDRLANLLPRLRTAREALARTILRAPIAGEVVGLAVFTRGGVVKPGERMLDIVPVAGPLLFEAQLRPEDVNRIAVGMTAEVRLAGIADARDPVLFGIVSTVSADRLGDQRSPEGYYAVEVRVEHGASSRHRLEPGMPATVTIATDPRTALDYMVGPLRDRLSRAMREE